MSKTTTPKPPDLPDVTPPNKCATCGGAVYPLAGKPIPILCERCSSKAHDVALTASEAWDLRGIADAMHSHHQALARYQSDFERVARAACERSGVAFRPDMQVHVDDGEVVLR